MTMIKYMKFYPDEKNSKINIILIEKYRDMLRNPKIEQNKYSITQQVFTKLHMIVLG